MPLLEQPGLPSQSDTDTIARSLLGDDLAQRYGDVIGSRPRTPADAVRDTTISGSQGNETLDGLKAQVAEQYNAGLQAATEAASAKKRADEMTVRSVGEGIRAIRSGYSPSSRVQAYAALLEEHGITADKTVLKEFEAEAEEGGIAADEVLDRLAGGMSTDDLKDIFGTVKGYAKFMAEIKEAKAGEVETESAALRIASSEPTRYGIAAGDVGKSRYTIEEL